MRDIRKNVAKRIGKKVLENEYIELGNNIKKRRKEKNFTQELLSNGICSVSYLSKLENGVIKPNVLYVEEILDRMNVENKSIIPSTIYIHNLEELIESMYFMNLMDISANHKNAEKMDNIIGRLIVYGSSILLDDLQSQYDEYTQLSYFIDSMDDLTLKSYILFSAILAYKNEDYLEALKLVQAGNKVKSNNDNLEAVFDLYAFNVYNKLNLKFSSMEHYYKAKSIITNNLSIYLFNRLELDYIEYFVNENYLYAYDIFNKLNFSSIENEELIKKYNYIKALFLFMECKYELCIDFLRNKIISQNDYNMKNLLFKSYLELGNKNDFYEMYNSFNEEEENINLYMQTKIEIDYILMESTNDAKNKIEYITNIAFAYFFRKQNLKLINFFVDELIDIYVSISRYKYANEVYRKREKFIDKINSIVNQR